MSAGNLNSRRLTFGRVEPIWTILPRRTFLNFLSPLGQLREVASAMQMSAANVPCRLPNEALMAAPFMLARNGAAQPQCAWPFGQMAINQSFGQETTLTLKLAAPKTTWLQVRAQTIGGAGTRPMVYWRLMISAQLYHIELVSGGGGGGGGDDCDGLSAAHLSSRRSDDSI